MDTRTKIITASNELFLEHGLKSITMDEIAETVGMSKRTIYENFENKHALISACIDYLHERKMESENDMIKSSENIIEELFLMLKNAKVMQKRESRLAQELKKFFPDLFMEHYQKRSEEMSARLQQRLQRGIEQGIILPNTNIRLSVFMIFETIYEIVARPDRLINTNIDIEEAFKYVLISFFRGIATAKGVELIDKTIKI